MTVVSEPDWYNNPWDHFPMDIVEQRLLQIIDDLCANGHPQRDLWEEAIGETIDTLHRLQAENERLDQLAEHNALIALHREDEIKRLMAEVARLEAELRVAYKLPSAINVALAPPPQR